MVALRYNVYHFVNNIIKTENISICLRSVIGINELTCCHLPARKQIMLFKNLPPGIFLSLHQPVFVLR